MTALEEVRLLTKIMLAVRTFCEVLFVLWSVVIGYALYEAVK